MATNGKQWVLLAAGSKDWENYRHQADVCHAYQVFHQNGIPDEQIVVMMYDDIAYNEENPVPGHIINVPNGPDVYNGVPKDYTGEDVSPANFLAVLRGDSEAITNRGSKKVIRSCANDSIFVYLSDHGGHGSFRFPKSTLYAHDLIDTVKEMSKKGQFSKMVIYMEACHSGSMLNELPELGNVYAVAACKPNDKSYACFYDRRRNAYLADVFTAYWLHHTEKENLLRSTFEDQFNYVKTKVLKNMTIWDQSQTPYRYGNTAMFSLPLSELLGYSPEEITSEYVSQSRNFVVNNAVDSKDVPLLIQKNRITNEQNDRRKAELERKYNDLKRKRKIMDEAMHEIDQHCRSPESSQSLSPESSQSLSPESSQSLSPESSQSLSPESSQSLSPESSPSLSPESSPSLSPESSQSLSDEDEMTRTYNLKVVAEHFRTTVFNWEEDAFVLTHSHLQVLVNLFECGFAVGSIIAAIDYVGRIRF